MERGLTGGNEWRLSGFEATQIPEPGAAALLGCGLLALA